MDSIIASNIEYLRLFIKKADELRKYSYFENGTSIIKFRITEDGQGNPDVIFEYPNNEQKKALLLTLRMFWQRDDFIYYRKFLEFYSQMPFSSKWKFEVRDIFFIFDMQLDSWATEGKARMTNKELFKIFLYGDEGHLSQRKKYLQLIRNNETKRLFEHSFHQIIINFSVAIFSLANITRRELLYKGISIDEIV